MLENEKAQLAELLKKLAENRHNKESLSAVVDFLFHGPGYKEKPLQFLPAEKCYYNTLEGLEMLVKELSNG